MPFGFGIGLIGTDNLAAGAVTNAKVNAAAAIAYTKLALGTSIVNADIAAGAAIALEKLASAPALITTGTYSGNSSANRAIAHSLGAAPKVVLIVGTDASYFSHLVLADNGSMTGNQGASNTTGIFTVTAPDATNFYVGNASSYPVTGNQTGGSYRWYAWS